jgi:LPPG:FO 2-phospho-L-lactate transferase
MMPGMNVSLLTGGGGGARLAAGLASALNPEELTIVVNTGDDERIRGLHISPDVDTVLYYLSGLIDWQRGWGLAKESFSANDAFRELVVRAGLDVDMQEWFALGDRDLATHMFRTRLMHRGASLTAATGALARALGVAVPVLPMSDDPQRTLLETPSGEELDFQTYFVRHQHRDEISAVAYEGNRVPSRAVIEAVAGAAVVLIGPSNPMLSIGPILALRGVRDAIGTSVAVSPIVGSKAVKGPADMLLASLGHEVSCVGVARIYEGLVNVFVLDAVDAERAPEIEALGMRTIVSDTMMPGPDEATRVAKEILDGL